MSDYTKLILRLQGIYEIDGGGCDDVALVEAIEAIQKLTAERDALKKENERLRNALQLVDMLRQLGGMMPGTEQVVRSVVDAIDAAMEKEVPR